MADAANGPNAASRAAPNAAKTSDRLDKWLWHARVTRTRTLAKKLVEAGKVRLNRTKTNAPGHVVRIGDVLTITLPRAILVYQIAAIAERRGPFSEAVKLYVDKSPAQPAQSAGKDVTGAHDILARPDARDRRAARRLAGKPQ